ncbi:MAG: hypothetical protein ABI091_21855 [Ferruginibacter sp.]
MNDFDFLIATPVVPKPKRLLTAKEIAVQMTSKKYRTYFDKNRENNIPTFQDNEILEYLNSCRQRPAGKNICKGRAGQCNVSN